MKMQKKIFFLFVTIISILSLGLSTVSASSPSDPQNSNSSDKYLIKVENFPEETDMDKLLELALIQNDILHGKITSLNSDSDYDVVKATQVLSIKTYSDNSTETEFAVSNMARYKEGSGGKYDVGAVVTMYYTMFGTPPFYADASFRAERITTRINDALADPRYVSRLQMSYTGAQSPNEHIVNLKSPIYSNPSNGTTYTLFTNDSRKYYNNILAVLYGGAVLTFNDGTQISITVVLI